MAARYIVHLARELRIEDRGETNTPLPVLVMVGRHIANGKAWMAEVAGVNEEAPGGFEQAFLSPASESLTREGNGVQMFSLMRDGIYQANSIWQGYEEHRVVLRVRDGAVEILAASSQGDTPARIRTALYVALTGAPKPRKPRAKKEPVPA